MTRVAIVTGAESGIGRATAVALAQDGFDVGITWYRSEDDASATAEEVRSHGRRAELAHHDLSKLPQGADAIDELAERLGGVYALVNNAGLGKGGPVLELTFDDWRETLAVDLDGAFLCAQRAARRMVAAGDGGRIVNITSVHEHTPLVGSAAYTAAKHGLGGFTKVLAAELAPHRITVNAVAPGLIATPMTEMEDVDVESVDKPHIPAGRPGDAREIASAVAWLCSEGASYATGQSFVVDGGFTLTNPSYRPERE